MEMYVQCMQDNYNNLFRDDDQREGVEGETYRTFELDLRPTSPQQYFQLLPVNLYILSQFEPWLNLLSRRKCNSVH